MKKKWAIVFLTFLLLACKKEEKLENSPKDSIDSIAGINSDSSVIYGSNVGFETFPFPDMQGCACSFATDKTNFEKGNFVFVDDYGAQATIKYQGQFLNFPMEEGDFDPSHFERVLKNKDFILKMNAEKVNSDPEIMIFKGVMTLTTPDGKSYTTPIYGACAC